MHRRQIYSALAACRGRRRWRRRQQAHGTIDWVPQAETSQFRAPVSRDRLGLLSYKIPPLFFSHLPKKEYFSFLRQMFLKKSLRFEGVKTTQGRQIVCTSLLELLYFCFAVQLFKMFVALRCFKGSLVSNLNNISASSNKN